MLPLIFQIAQTQSIPLFAPPRAFQGLGIPVPCAFFSSLKPPTANSVPLSLGLMVTRDCFSGATENAAVSAFATACRPGLAPFSITARNACFTSGFHSNICVLDGATLPKKSPPETTVRRMTTVAAFLLWLCRTSSAIAPDGDITVRKDRSRATVFSGLRSRVVSVGRGLFRAAGRTSICLRDSSASVV